MTSKPKDTEIPAQKMIDFLAEGQSAEVKAALYREMTYCHSLPQNDEMLRIISILGILTALIKQIPTNIAVEREGFKRLFAEATYLLNETLSASTRYLKDLNARLTKLPEEIGSGINARTIADSINENLRQQFALSTIPQTAQALASAAGEMKGTAKEFSTTAENLGDSYRGCVAKAQQAISDINKSVSHAADTANRAIDEFTSHFHNAYWRSLYGLTGLAFLLGFSLALIAVHWFS
jgi:methyl-accepting chemotaxis protein